MSPIQMGGLKSFKRILRFLLGQKLNKRETPMIAIELLWQSYALDLIQTTLLRYRNDNFAPGTLQGS